MDPIEWTLKKVPSIGFILYTYYKATTLKIKYLPNGGKLCLS